jgi:CRISPR-associated endonuclease Cas3-HD
VVQPYLRFWAKTRDLTSLQYHPVAFHGLDVAASGRRLLEVNDDLRRRLARISGLGEERLLDWICFLLALHDFGKLADSFQCLRGDLMFHLQGRSSDLRYVERHDALGRGLWCEIVFPSLTAQGELGLEAAFQEDWADLLKPWLAAVFGHHGKPVAYQEKELTSKLFPPSIKEAALLFVRSLAELFLPAGLPFSLEPFAAQEDSFRAASWLLAGGAVAADWIGSNSEWFPFHAEPLELEEYWRQIARPQAETAVRKSGLIPAAPGTAGGVRDLWPKILAPTPGPIDVLPQGRWAGQQFDDDLNQLPLRGYVVADLSLRRPIGNRLDVFLSAENLFDRKVVTGRTPIETLGAPRLVQVGVKVRREAQAAAASGPLTSRLIHQVTRLTRLGVDLVSSPLRRPRNPPMACKPNEGIAWRGKTAPMNAPIPALHHGIA